MVGGLVVGLILGGVFVTWWTRRATGRDQPSRRRSGALLRRMGLTNDWARELIEMTHGDAEQAVRLAMAEHSREVGIGINEARRRAVLRLRRDRGR